MIWRAVYALATVLALPLVLLYFAWRGRREPGYRRHWAERLGGGPHPAQRAIWVHAASVGEMVLAGPLVAALRERYPDTPFLITTMTPTGRDRADRQFGDFASIHYMPLDTRGATRRFMRAARPRIGILVETELWPHLIAAADACDVPLAVVNASISDRSAQRYARWPLVTVTRFMLGRLSGLGAASDAHARRFAALGAPRERVRVTGNLKYDHPGARMPGQSARALRAQWQARDRPVWVAASTHHGEEALLVETFERLRETHDRALLVIAPRHPQRFDEVAALLARTRWQVASRSRGDVVNAQTDIVLADTLGEVPMFYGAADVVFVGGSLVPGIGGHNVIEAAAAARPLCVGPYVDEWRDIVDALVETGAARICDSLEALAAAVGDWFAAPARARRDGEAGLEHVQQNAGALEATLDMIHGVIARRGATKKRIE